MTKAMVTTNPRRGKITNRVERQEEEFHRLMEEMDIKLDKEKADDAEVVDGPPLPPPDGEPPYDGPEHHSMGKPGDGIIYLSDIGEHVKLDIAWTTLSCWSRWSQRSTRVTKAKEQLQS